jgi:hypothetical protein
MEGRLLAFIVREAEAAIRVEAQAEMKPRLAMELQVFSMLEEAAALLRLVPAVRAETLGMKEEQRPIRIRAEREMRAH